MEKIWELWGMDMERRLLIIEDDCLMAEAAADYFTGKGWGVETKEDGMSALELLQRKSFCSYQSRRKEVRNFRTRGQRSSYGCIQRKREYSYPRRRYHFRRFLHYQLSCSHG